ncbi:MAG TPA: TIGR01777 family oxidoreductase [Longimicrobiaceae bacterium]
MNQTQPRSQGRPVIGVTGASGFLGSALVELLSREGYRILRLVRRPPRDESEVRWDPETGELEAKALEGVAGVVHLAGETIDQRWTDQAKRRLWDSRVRGTRVLAQGLATLTAPPEVLVSGSAIGYYGADRGDEILEEESAPGTDFLAQLGVAWEEAAAPAREAGIRVVHPRFGIVLASHGGALRRMLPAFRLGVGGRLGSGRQWMSWVSLPDAVRAIHFALENRSLRGPCNVVAPEPVSNAAFTEELGRALRRPTWMVVPELALRAVYGEMAIGTILANQRVRPKRLLESGFQFLHPTLDRALHAIFHSSS